MPCYLGSRGKYGYVINTDTLKRQKLMNSCICALLWSQSIKIIKTKQCPKEISNCRRPAGFPGFPDPDSCHFWIKKVAMPALGCHRIVPELQIVSFLLHALSNIFVRFRWKNCKMVSQMELLKDSYRRFHLSKNLWRNHRRVFLKKLVAGRMELWKTLLHDRKLISRKKSKEDSRMELLNPGAISAGDILGICSSRSSSENNFWNSSGSSLGNCPKVPWGIRDFLLESLR